MTSQRLAGKLSFGKNKWLFAAIGVTVATGFVVFNVVHVRPIRAAPQSESKPASAPAFEVASIKLNKSVVAGRITMQPGGRLTAIHARLGNLIAFAYQLSFYSSRFISGLPDWSRSEPFDIEAKAEGNPTKEQLRSMLQSLLADRFKLIVHRETRQTPAYALTIEKNGRLGPQLFPHTDATKCSDSLTETSSPGTSECGVFSGPLGRQTAYAVTMAQLAYELSYSLLDHPVVDRTGLSGTFDLSFAFQPEADSTKTDPNAIPYDSSGLPSVFTAVKEQLGLKLELQMEPIDFVVIDHVEQPSEN